jgi:hypothetical protein
MATDDDDDDDVELGLVLHDATTQCRHGRGGKGRSSVVVAVLPLFLSPTEILSGERVGMNNGILRVDHNGQNIWPTVRNTNPIATPTVFRRNTRGGSVRPFIFVGSKGLTLERTSALSQLAGETEIFELSYFSCCYFIAVAAGGGDDAGAWTKICSLQKFETCLFAAIITISSKSHFLM